MSVLDQHLRRKIIKLLTPHLKTIPAQQTLVDDAFFDAENLRAMIHYIANARQFAGHLVSVCSTYGDIKPGTLAIVALLDALREYVGGQQNRDIDAILAEIATRQRQHSETANNPSETPESKPEKWTKRQFRAAYDEAGAALEQRDFAAAIRILETALAQHPPERMKNRMAQFLSEIRRDEEYYYISEKLQTGRHIDDWCDDFADFQQDYPDYDPDDLVRVCLRNRVERYMLLHTLSGHTGFIYSISFSPDGKLLAFGSDNRTLQLWDVSSGQLLKTLTGYFHNVDSMVFSPGGRVLASCSADETIRLWDVGNEQLLYTLTGHTGQVRSVSFSSNGRLLASCSRDKTVRLWDANSGQLLHTLTGHIDNVLSVSFSPDGRVLASCSDDNTVRLWDAGNGELLHILTGHTMSVDSVSFSLDSKLLASASLDKTVRLWDAGSGRLINTLTEHSDGVNSVSFSPDGWMLASTSEDQTVRLWDVNSGQLIHALIGHTEGVATVSFSPDGRVVASGSWDKTVRLWGVP